jgi:hypothetical protein
MASNRFFRRIEHNLFAEGAGKRNLLSRLLASDRSIPGAFRDRRESSRLPAIQGVRLSRLQTDPDLVDDSGQDMVSNEGVTVFASICNNASQGDLSSRSGGELPGKQFRPERFGFSRQEEWHLLRGALF